MLKITLNTQRLQSDLQRLQVKIKKASPLMAGIALELRSATEGYFAAESGPTGKWQKHSAVTLALRGKARSGQRPKILQASGQLAASVQTSHNANSASIFTNKPYAAIQHFGGTTSAKSMIPGKVIPARPFLPFIGDAQAAQMPAALEDAISGMIKDYLEGR